MSESSEQQVTMGMKKTSYFNKEKRAKSDLDRGKSIRRKEKE